MIDLQVREGNDATIFCVDHYSRAELWVDSMSPAYLPFHLRKHNCYSLTGVPRGLLYCQDLFSYNDAWGIEDLHTCF